MLPIQQIIHIESYKAHIAHVLLGIALAQPFVDLSSLITRLGVILILTITTFFYGVQLLLYKTFQAEFDIDIALMIYAMLLRILPQPVLIATGVGLLSCFILIGLQNNDLEWIIGRR